MERHHHRNDELLRNDLVPFGDDGCSRLIAELSFSKPGQSDGRSVGVLTDIQLAVNEFYLFSVENAMDGGDSLIRVEGKVCSTEMADINNDRGFVRGCAHVMRLSCCVNGQVTEHLIVILPRYCL